MEITTLFKTVTLSISLLLTTLTNAQTIELWGMTSEGGEYNLGTIFKTDENGNNFTVKYSFSDEIGELPLGKFCQAANGKLYGLTTSGGSNDWGVLFEYNPITSTYIKKIDFADTNGSSPKGSLIQASNGKLYGMTTGGGEHTGGTLFEYDPLNNSFSKKIDFEGNNGGYPHGNLIEASNGKLYGLTWWGGSDNIGVLFEYDYTTNKLSKKVDFNSSEKGTLPSGSLIQASNGKLYGMTSQGGIQNQGVLFEYDYKNDVFSKKVDFNYDNGSNPQGSLVQANNGKLYGMTEGGGKESDGVLFEYDIVSQTLSKKVDFTSVIGSNPYGDLMKASDGKLYGLTRFGGTNDYGGVLFEYDPTTNSFVKKMDFENSGALKPYGTLIEVDLETSILENTFKHELTLFPNPTKGDISIDLGSKYNSIETIVRDETGKEVLRQADKNTSTLKLNLEGKSGIYLIEVKSDKGEQAVLRVLKL
jgi:uncharacterized repeat protein (TIGR03803 family)